MIAFVSQAPIPALITESYVVNESFISDNNKNVSFHISNQGVLK